MAITAILITLLMAGKGETQKLSPQQAKQTVQQHAKTRVSATASPALPPSSPPAPGMGPPTGFHAVPGGFPLFGYKAYLWIWCDSKWNQNCGAVYTITAPEGFQACNLVYTIESKVGNAGVDYAWTGGTPKTPYKNDDPVLHKYPSIRFSISSQGSGNPFDQTGGSIHLKDVGITMLPADADVKTRMAYHCRFHPGNCGPQCCSAWPGAMCPMLPH